MLVEMLWVLTLVAIQRKQRFAYTRLLSVALHHFLLFVALLCGVILLLSNEGEG
jgi:hypothetical protein